MKEGTTIVLDQNLKDLNLRIMLESYPTVVRDAKESGISYEEFLLSLTDVELRIRGENRLKRRIKEARFPLLKTFEAFDFDAATGLDVRLIRDLMSGQYLIRHHNIIFLGKSGTGKTHMAIGLGVEACRHGKRVRFTTGCGLVNELIESRSDRCLSRLIDKYARYDLLIIDELGYVPFSKEGAELLFQVLAQRHEKASVIITSNLGFADWTQIFGEATLTAALLDRLTHKAHIITCAWESFRLKESLKRKGAGLSGKKIATNEGGEKDREEKMQIVDSAAPAG